MIKNISKKVKTFINLNNIKNNYKKPTKEGNGAPLNAIKPLDAMDLLLARSPWR
jgi:hypothetical protein